MIYAIIHRISEQVLDKYDAVSVQNCLEQYVQHHPELEVDTAAEFAQFYPALSHNLYIIPLN